MSVTLYHNPRCSKSRQTLQLLQERNLEPAVIEYLKTPPDAATLSAIIGMLGTDAAGIMRTGEAEYKAAKEEVLAMDENAKLEWLSANPKVIQRPVVINNGQARIGRPPESVLEIV